MPSIEVTVVALVKERVSSLAGDSLSLFAAAMMKLPNRGRAHRIENHGSLGCLAGRYIDFICFCVLAKRFSVGCDTEKEKLRGDQFYMRLHLAG